MKKNNDELMMIALEHQELASVTFVRDYIQLNFDGPAISFYTFPAICKDGIKIQQGDPGYRDELCKLTGEKVTAVKEVVDEDLTITFGDLSSVVVSLKPEDRRSAESAMFQGGDGKGWIVW